MPNSNQHDADPAADANAYDSPARGTRSGAEFQEAIRRRAQEIYENSGRIPGRDLENWAQAEAEIHNESGQSTTRRPAVVVKVEGVQYVGEYESGLAFGYTPGEFVAGDQVRVRFDSGKMYVLRPNGQHLETTIIARIG
ncbi:MAG TPA: DUF2934 domain-containing protein [Candidatus Sulfotelmatobacter sp.]